MNIPRSKIIDEITCFINKMKTDHIDILPHVFGKLNEDYGLKTYDVDLETIIPTVLCINAPVLNQMATFKTAIHINNYIRAGKRAIEIKPDITRVSTMIIMLASVGYSFNQSTVPFINNTEIHQMWADIEQLAKSDHVGSVLMAVASRGRSYKGFASEHAPRASIAAPDIIPVPTYFKVGNNQNVIRINS